MLTGAEDKALQGCNLSADFGARPGLGELGSPKPVLPARWDGRKRKIPEVWRQSLQFTEDPFLVVSDLRHSWAGCWFFFACSMR